MDVCNVPIKTQKYQTAASTVCIYIVAIFFLAYRKCE